MPVAAQDTFYVSATGDDKNDGFSEDKPLKTLSFAVNQTMYNDVEKIVVAISFNSNFDYQNGIIKDNTAYWDPDVFIEVEQ